MSSAILNLDVEKSAVTPFNSATVSCIVSRIVPLNVDKNGFVRNLYPITLKAVMIALPGFFFFNDFIKTDKSLDTIQYKLHKHK